MILIADCGSTKIDWCVLQGTETIARFETPGMNAVMTTPEEMRQRMGAELAPHLADKADKIINAYFYGAGCISPQVCANVADAIKTVTPQADVEVASDLLGAARALCGREPGVACILGTGSNSCYYDGTQIVKNVSPLGYILGDEGSGAVLGKILVGNVLKHQLPDDLCQKFLDQNGLDLLTIIDRVYRKPQANKFLASLSPFLLQNISRREVYVMLIDAFSQFFKRNLDYYFDSAPAQGKRVANFVGSIAHYYRGPLEDAANICGYHIGTIMKSPMDGLISFHSQS